MNADLEKALENYLLAMGDDELILGHRNSEWCGHAPILEEDIAFANIALDEIGHASVWYSLLAELVGEDPEKYPDRLVFLREAGHFRNAQVVELPKGDWAFSMLRQYLFDVFENKQLLALSGSAHRPLAEAAAKIRTEEIYHLRHTSAWVKRLGLGTKESNQRLQRALNELWPHTSQLFIHLEDEAVLVSGDYVPAGEKLRQEWENAVVPFLEDCGLAVPETGSEADEMITRDTHTSHLNVLLTEMQSVARLDEQASW
jgi:ring-1,2-phenylacetyl-CoA epoxidase subunit PaaC